MKKHLLIVFIFIPIQWINSQIYSETYGLEKKTMIPIGNKTSEVMVEYLILGKYVGLPDAISIDNSGNFIIGSRLQNETIQKFDNDGKFLSVLSKKGFNDNNVNYPFRIVTDNNNSDYVLDALKYLDSGVVGIDYSIKKFDSTEKFVYKLAYADVRGNVTENDRIDELWVTADGIIYFKDWYNSKTEKSAFGDSKTERMIFMVDKIGNLVDQVDYVLYKTNKKEFLKLDVTKDYDEYFVNLDYLTQPDSPAVKGSNILNTNQLDLKKTQILKIKNSKDKPEFLV